MSIITRLLYYYILPRMDDIIIIIIVIVITTTYRVTLDRVAAIVDYNFCRAKEWLPKGS